MPVVGGAVEGAVAQGDPAEVGDRLLEIGHRGGALVEVLRRRGVERIVLRLDGSALAGVPGEGSNALRHESAYAGLARGRQQRVRPLRSQLAGLGGHLVHVAAELHVRQRGRLVDDRLGLHLEHDLAHRTRVEQVEPDRLRAPRPQQLCARRRAVGTDHLVRGINQLRDETAPDCTARPGNEHTHDPLLSLALSSEDTRPTMGPLPS
jgi:hypothetical protein